MDKRALTAVSSPIRSKPKRAPATAIYLAVLVPLFITFAPYTSIIGKGQNIMEEGHRPSLKGLSPFSLSFEGEGQGIKPLTDPVKRLKIDSGASAIVK